MSKISAIRPILLSAPYAHAENLEVRWHLPSGYRTCGLVEITLDDGITGLGEGYLAVFAPAVFVEIVNLMATHLVGRESGEIQRRYRDMCQVSDYWSLQGAARHVISALEMALVDARAKQLGIPAYDLLGGRVVDQIDLYGSGGDSYAPKYMSQELDLLESKGIGLFKIRARKHQVDKAVWVLDQAHQRGIKVGIDMTQNLANPAQSVSDVIGFVEAVQARSAQPIHFIEEVLGPFDLRNYPALRQRVTPRVAGGEIVTTAQELCERIRLGYYDWAQPDATVIGGIYPTLEVFTACRQQGIEAVVHCWGGAVCMMANYHAAFAGGGLLAEWPMPAYSIREDLLVEPLGIQGGKLRIGRASGLGVRLTPQLEEKYRFRPEAVYRCFPDFSFKPSESAWK